MAARCDHVSPVATCRCGSVGLAIMSRKRIWVDWGLCRFAASEPGGGLGLGSWVKFWAGRRTEIWSLLNYGMDQGHPGFAPTLDSRESVPGS